MTLRIASAGNCDLHDLQKIILGHKIFGSEEEVEEEEEEEEEEEGRR